MWPGNMRQFERVIQRARERAIARNPSGRVLDVEHFDPREFEHSLPRQSSPPSPSDLPSGWSRLETERRAIDEREVALIKQALAKHGGVVAHAAKELGIARTTLSSRLDALGLRR